MPYWHFFANMANMTSYFLETFKNFGSFVKKFEMDVKDFQPGRKGFK